jgi:hypothetical protein
MSLTTSKACHEIGPSTGAGNALILKVRRTPDVKVNGPADSSLPLDLREVTFERKDPQSLWRLEYGITDQQGVFLGQLTAEAGFPPGVVNIISGAGDTGSLLSSHMKIR